MASINWAAIMDGHYSPLPIKLFKAWTISLTRAESIPSGSEESSGMALPTTSGTGTARAVFDSRVVSFRRCAYNVALAARIVSATKAAGPVIARHWKILLLGCLVALLLAPLGDEFLW